MRTLLVAALLAALAGLAAGQQGKLSQRPSAAADSMQRKLEQMRRNADAGKAATTVLTEAEINAWLGSKYAQLPKGVHRVRMVGQNGRITANAEIDFDEIKEGASSMNPLMALFGGRHDVQVAATGLARNGTATVHVDSVEINGVSVPRVALEYFLEHYVTPKYPNVGIDSTFRPGYRVDSAQIGEHQLTIVQK